MTGHEVDLVTTETHVAGHDPETAAFQHPGGDVLAEPADAG
ncbi:MAG TPA: hypothetical protein VLD62_03525 [Acidimicrobiia bacterium]|nr:hypothetical protein [Acidimicrobiia bacterium]